MASNFDVYMNYVNNEPVLQDSSGKAIGKITLEYEDTMTIHPGTGFQGTTALTNVEIFNWVNGVKGSSVGSWTGTNTTVGVLAIAASGSEVIVTDSDRGNADGDYGYAATLTATKNGTGTLYTVDPELVAKKKRGGTRQAARPSASQPTPEAGA